MSSLEKTARIIANALSRRIKGKTIQVTVCGQVAFTDGNNITLPVDVDMTGTKRIRMLGYLIHEIAHIKFTDFSRAPSSLVNAIEDARIEGKVKKVYAGAAYFLDGLNEDLTREMIAKTGDFLPCSPHARIATYVYAVLAGPHSPVMADYARRAASRIRTMIGSQRHDLLMKLLAKMPTSKVWELSLEIEKLLGQKPEPETSTASQDAARQQSSTTAAGSEGQCESGKSAQSRQSTSTSNESCTEQTDRTPSQGEGSSLSQSDDQSSGNDSSKGLGQGGTSEDDLTGGDSAYEDIYVSCKGKQFSDSPVGTMASTEFATESARSAFDMKNVEGSEVEVTLSANTKGEYPKRRLFGEIKPETESIIAKGKLRAASLGRSLTGLAQAKSRDYVSLCKTGRRISTRHLARLSTCNMKVFMSKNEKIRRDTAIALLMDRSGSMQSMTEDGRQRIDVALEALVAVRTALDRLPGVKTCVEVFPSTVHRFPLECVVEFGESVDKAVVNIQQAKDPLGGTPINDAVLLAGNRLMKRREARKIVLVFTDGNCTIAHEIESCIRSGIEVAVISLGSAPSHYEKLSAYVCIQNMEKLSEAFFELAKSMQIGVAQAR